MTYGIYKARRGVRPYYSYTHHLGPKEWMYFAVVFLVLGIGFVFMIIGVIVQG